MGSGAIQSIFFDAVGTVLHPTPSVAEAYWQVGQRHGSSLGLEQVRWRIRAAFAAQEAWFQAHDQKTGDLEEQARWRRVVSESLPDVPDREQCFADLHDHFGRPENWRLSDGLPEVLEQLLSAGLTLGIASNFDGRLHRVCAGFPCFSMIRHWVISSEVGWRKPSPHFYARMGQETGLSACQILLVGDDPLNDLHAPSQYGMHGMLVQSPACLKKLAGQLARPLRVAAV
ncbi:MAG: HAD family hydrolase [Planctomycetota bacterium]|nr:HAD family hydrolase [Planctomycetota bacterium]RLS40969.1 MAG: haloacid dehalogenase [Planctomycetota bacterium]